MQTGFYFDQARCTGCFTCSVACKDWHDTPAGPANWIRIHYREDGKFPKVFVSHVASPCYHCKEPVCAYVCPNEALTKREEDGIVVVDRDKCRGDKTCGIVSEAAMGPGYLYGAGVAPCQAACPAGLHIPGYVTLIAKGKNKEALDLIRQRMPLPSVCGRVCLHPCETACRRQEVEQPIAIMALKGFVTNNVSQQLPERLSQVHEDKVAIVGSGPAGLAAAYDFIRAGYGVTVFESMPVAGGMLSAGIPEHRLPRQALKRDIDHIKALGVEIKTSTPVGPGLSIDDLFNQGYGAVLVTVGAHKGQKPSIPGADLQGVLAGTAFMWDVNFAGKVKVGEKVLVIGGGNVALDCARSARRLGAREVTVATLECRADLPAEVDEIAQAEQEGICVDCELTPVRILGGGGKVTGVEVLGVAGLQFYAQGRPSFQTVAGRGKTFQVDTVIFAIGQTPDLTGLSGNGGVTAGALGTVAVDEETLMSPRPGLFAAGDCVTGATSVVDAIASGQKAAFYINRYLQGDVMRVRPEKVVDPADIKTEIPADVQKAPRQAMPMLCQAERLSSFQEVTLGYSPEAAMEEAKRCLNCAGHLCKDVCPYSAPQFAAEEKAKMQKCDLCVDRWAENKKPICVEACPVRALDAGPLEQLEAKYGQIKDAYAFVYSATVEPSIVNKPKKRP